MSPGVGPEKDCTGEAQQQLYRADPSSRLRGCYIRTSIASVQLENIHSGSGSQEARRKDEMIGVKPPVVK
jgi:hypothetical protein